ncbi:MAG: metallophosphoesterase [Actinomycetota bacterium]|nr:metallophosphoesterase [Actinomycetota bacterium]
MGARPARSGHGGVRAGVLAGVVAVVALGLAVWLWVWPFATVTEDFLPGSAPAGGLRRNAWTVADDQLTFAVVGDNGSGGRNALRVANQMARAYQRVPYGLIVNVGDLVYYGSLADRYDEVLVRPLKPLLDAGVVVRPAIGNHEWDYESTLRELELLGLPGRYYAFRSGPAEFFMLDSTPPHFDGDGGAAQLAWLQQRLQGSTAPWKFVVLHHSPYSSGRHGSYLDIREKLEPLLVQYGVDVVFSGHDHDYERTTPQQGIVYVVSGAGAKLTPVGSSDFTAASAEKLQFVLVEIKGRQLTATAIDDKGDEFDRFTLDNGGSA